MLLFVVKSSYHDISSKNLDVNACNIKKAPSDVFNTYLKPFTGKTSMNTETNGNGIPPL